MTHPLFQLIKASSFFPLYAPGVNNYQRKLAGKSGKGKPLAFTENDKRLIKEGFEKFIKEMRPIIKIKS